MLVTLALWGCDCDCNGGPFAAAITTAGVSTVAPVVLVVRPAFAPPVVFTEPSAIIDLRIAASTTVDLQQATIHMIDGTNLGGPMVTVPRTDLVQQFGSTRIAAGTTRTFTFRPTFVFTTFPRSVAADITVQDSRGVAFAVSAQSPWP